jgi:polar amino acid transport system permease protein
VTYQFEFGDIWPYRDVLLQGAWLTLELTALSTLIGVSLGTLLAVARARGGAPLRMLVGLYVELIRNTPFLVQLFFVFFGLPSVGIKLSANQAAVLAMIVNLSAYSVEIIRAGVEAVPKGQSNAARSLGLSERQIMQSIVLPQAFVVIYPALASQIVIVMLGSSVVSQISAEELTFAANFIQSRNFRAFEVYAVVTLLYLALAIAVRLAFRLAGEWCLPKRPVPGSA